MAAERKAEKDHNLSSDHIFQPIAMENLGAFSSSSLEFLRELGRRLGSLSGEEREDRFLFQRLSVAIQRFNSVLLHNGFTDDIPDLQSFRLFLSFLFLTLGRYTLEGIKNNNNNNNNDRLMPI